MNNQRKLMLCLLVAAGIGLSFSCKKVVDGPGDGDGASGGYYGGYTFTNSLNDSLYMYAKAFYLWNDDLPSFAKFDPSKYESGNSLTGLKNELYALTQIPVNAETNKPYEYDADFPGESKYSYMLLTADNTGGGNSSFVIKPNTQSFTLDGKGNDLGIHFGFTSPYAVDENGDYIVDTDGNRKLNRDTTITVLKYVDNGSPAQKAGLKRGDVIYKMNGEAKDFNSFSSDKELQDYYNGILDGSSLDIVKVDSVYPKTGKRKETMISLQKKQYDFNPVILDSVISLPGGKKVGYLVFEGFTQLENAKAPIDAALKKFAGVTDLVVDLRYNGGGAVETAEYLANAFVASGNDGKTLYSMHYNDSLRDESTYSSFLKTVLKSQKLYEDDGVTPTGKTTLDIDYSVAGNTEKVKKSGAISTASNKIYFIVAGGTASASELLINALKPYNNVVLVGAWYAEDPEEDDGGHTQIRTYGKPVGFFDLRIGEYTVYMSMFQSLNSKGEGDYYSGMLTDGLGYDDVLADFGKSEDRLESLNQILATLDSKFKVPGTSFRAALSTNIKPRQNPATRASIRSYEAEENRRNFKPMVKRTIQLR
ncbi:S41 family peptidase [Arachidicoccus terrestris]|uniref:S41 family peptidase n=1 Tax=Arachidicoccus terrestris TaxID=2875539 RepID=UPI001CC50FD9|nr:S41 family peptidase [Arachidicoccus terrestris]UAY56124.1 PDZ domain-containing protein [Arachidicoccus terrestris]